MNDNLRHRLDDLATGQVSGPEPAFTDALESRLRHLAGSAHPDDPSLPEASGRVVPLRRRLILPAVAAAAAAAVIAALAVMPSGVTHPRVQLAGATDTQVIGPDGRVGQAAPGAVVADGSIVQTGPSGQTQAGGVVIGPNSEALAVDGHLQTVTVGRDRSARDNAGADHAAVVHLTVRRTNGMDVLRWTRIADQNLYGYLVLRTAGGGAPSDRDAVSFTTGATSVAPSAPDAVVTYRIVAVDRQGRVLASSNSVTSGRG